MKIRILALCIIQILSSDKFKPYPIFFANRSFFLLQFLDIYWAAALFKNSKSSQYSLIIGPICFFQIPHLSMFFNYSSYMFLPDSTFINVLQLLVVYVSSRLHIYQCSLTIGRICFFQTPHLSMSFNYWSYLFLPDSTFINVFNYWSYLFLPDSTFINVFNYWSYIFLPDSTFINVL